MKKFANFRSLVLLFVIVFHQYPAKGQTIKDSLYNMFSVKDYIFSSGDFKINALISNHKERIKKKKNLIIFISGSLPIPLVINSSEGAFSPFPFNYKQYLSENIFVILPKPGVPILTEKSILDEQLRFLNFDGSPLKQYYENNNLDYYVKIHNDFINKYTLDTNLNIGKIIVIGHSQGYHIACKLASINNKITNLICMSSNPYNRFQQFLSEVRFYEYSGQIKSDSATILINKIYNNYERLNKNKDKNKEFFDGDTYKSWSSFTFFNNVNNFLSLKIPVLIVYGTNDIGSLSNDFLKLDCIKNKKTNITFLPLARLDHNFFENEFNENGDFVKQLFHWDSVFEKSYKWSIKN
jgi:hypothetical protein